MESSPKTTDMCFMLCKCVLFLEKKTAYILTVVKIFLFQFGGTYIYIYKVYAPFEWPGLQVRYLIVSIPNLCRLSCFDLLFGIKYRIPTRL